MPRGVSLISFVSVFCELLDWSAFVSLCLRGESATSPHPRGRLSSRYAVPKAAASSRSSCSPAGNVVISSNSSCWPGSTRPAPSPLQPERPVLHRHAERAHPRRLVLASASRSLTFGPNRACRTIRSQTAANAAVRLEEDHVRLPPPVGVVDQLHQVRRRHPPGDRLQAPDLVVRRPAPASPGPTRPPAASVDTAGSTASTAASAAAGSVQNRTHAGRDRHFLVRHATPAGTPRANATAPTSARRAASASRGHFSGHTGSRSSPTARRNRANAGFRFSSAFRSSGCHGVNRHQNRPSGSSRLIRFSWKNVRHPLPLGPAAAGPARPRCRRTPAGRPAPRWSPPRRRPPPRSGR